MDERDKAIADTAKEIRKEGEARRARAKAKPNRPSKYRYAGLEEHTTVLMPEGVNPDEYDIIGKDVTRILHRQAAKLWVEVVERPIMRLKADKEQPAPRIEQAAAPEAIIGGNHVGADLLAQLVIDKYTYHLPEYRQAKMYADLGVKLPTSTINDWIHAVAQKLYPLYESLGEQIRQSPSHHGRHGGVDEGGLPQVWAIHPRSEKPLTTPTNCGPACAATPLDGRYRIDNNAVFYSLLKSCDIVGVNPLEWSPHALGRLRPESTEEEITALLPYNYKKHMQSRE